MSVLHASSDAGFQIDGTVAPVTASGNAPPTAAASGLAPLQQSAPQSANPGPNVVRITRSGGGQLIAATPAETLENGRQYVAVVAGSAAPSAGPARQLGVTLVAHDPGAPAAGTVRMKIVHGAPDLPAFDVYLGRPGDPLPGAPAAGSPLAFRQQTTSAAQAPSGPLRLRLTRPNAPTEVLFDSGPVSIDGSIDVIAVVIPTTTSGDAVQVMIAPRAGSIAFWGDRSSAGVRFAQFVADASNIDVDFREAALELAPGTRVATGLPFGRLTSGPRSPFNLILPGRYIATGADADGLLRTERAFDFAATDRALLLLVGLRTAVTPDPGVARWERYPELAPVGECSAIPSGCGVLRFFNLAPDQPGAVDLVVLDGLGDPILPPLLGVDSSVTFPVATAPVRVGQGSYSIGVIAAGTSGPVIARMDGGASLAVPLNGTANLALVGCAGACANPLRLVAW